MRIRSNIIRHRTVGGDPIPTSRFAAKASIIALLILSITAAVSAQNIAELKKQAAAGDAKSQVILGKAYENGEGVPQDQVTAAGWFRKAAEQGEASAQFELGWLFEYGSGKQNPAAAVDWFRKAADQGYARAQFMLGVDYDLGYGVQHDPAQAAVWYREAAEQGDANSQQNLGWFYFKGKGVPQDYAEAYFWLDLAAATNENATKERDEAASHLTSANLSRVQERVRKWVQAHTRPVS